MGLSCPIGIDRHTGDGGGGGTAAAEERAREPRDVVLLHGHIELAAVELVATGIEGRDREGDVVGKVVQKGVEVELLTARRGDIELHVLLTVDTAQTRHCIEGAGAAGIVEPHLLDFRGDVVGDDETAECHNTVEGDLVIHRFFTDGHLAIAQKGVGVARGIGELYLRGGGHRGIATGIMAYDHQLVGALIELEGALSEVCVVGRLVDLLETRTAFIVDGEVQFSTCY